ncbi:hypothetical protein COLO4_11624 [Corchorus olitorius]|uniref:Pentacotripeptide-repeat region of PRORP domain-containing protein n=1 Tax=Corchorus olitorius TaxID=93759 RepID=A0A1R3K3U9_9ROSI|nr:hypothetical protein COLO4_11624 [Corchorus olitorius]
MRRFTSKTFSLIPKHRHLATSSYPNSHHHRHLSGNDDDGGQLSTNSKPSFGLVTFETKQTSIEPDNNQHSDDFASDVEKIYKILRNFHTRVPQLNLALQQSGVVLRPGLTERVLNRCGDAGHLGYKYFTWASKQPGYHPSYEIYKAMIKILGKMRQFGAVWALIEEIKKENPHFITAELFVVLMRRFASSKMVKRAIEVFDEMPKYGCPQDDAMFGSLLDALCKNGNVKEAALVFEELKEAGFEPDIVVYNNLLSGYVLAHKMGDAFDLLNDMRRQGIGPNANSYTIVIQGLCKADRMEEAMRIFVDMERNGCQGDVVAYTTLISGFCKWKKVDKAYELLDRMITKGLMPNTLTYLHILLAHEKKEDLEECLELMQEMKKIGCVPDAGIYNVIIRLACKLGEVKEAVRIWNEMEGSGFSPGVDSFLVMIHGFIGQGCLVEACEYFKEMVGRGLFYVPQYGVLKDLLNPLLRAGKLEMAKDVWACIVSKGCDLNVSAWTIWIHALFSKGHVKEACSYCLEMMDADLMPQPDTFAKLMRGLKKLYNRQIAAEITEKVRKMAADREMTFKMYKRRGERDLKEKEKAKTDGRKRRARRRRWGGARSRGDIS